MIVTCFYDLSVHFLRVVSFLMEEHTYMTCHYAMATVARVLYSSRYVGSNDFAACAWLAASLAVA